MGSEMCIRDRLCRAITDGNLHEVDVKFRNQATVCKYAVPEGYPDNPVKGEPIDVSGIENREGLFYASVDIKNDQLVEAGSRTVAVVGMADSITAAEQIAEREISTVTGPLFHRTDIGTKELVQKRIDHMDTLR